MIERPQSAIKSLNEPYHSSTDVSMRRLEGKVALVTGGNTPRNRCLFRCGNCDARFYRLKPSDGSESQDSRAA